MRCAAQPSRSRVALGAQEGGLVLLCALFGIPPEQAIALSLVKRVPDVVLGVPSLLAWQIMEWQRLQSKIALTWADVVVIGRNGCLHPEHRRRTDQNRDADGNRPTVVRMRADRPQRRRSADWSTRQHRLPIA